MRAIDYQVSGIIILIAAVLAGLAGVVSINHQQSDPAAIEQTQEPVEMTIKTDCPVPSTNPPLQVIATYDAETKRRIEDMRAAYLAHKAQVDLLLERSQALHDAVCCPNQENLW